MKHRLSDIASSVYAQFLEMTARELRQAYRAANEMNDRNCGWTAYEMRSVFVEFIGAAAQCRRRKARP